MHHITRGHNHYALLAQRCQLFRKLKVLCYDHNLRKLWEQDLQVEAQRLLAEGRTDVWDVLTRRFETRLIQTALATTRGRRIEAAHKLGIGRNTITRKIQELDLE